MKVWREEERSHTQILRLLRKRAALTGTAAVLLAVDDLSSVEKDLGVGGDVRRDTDAIGAGGDGSLIGAGDNGVDTVRSGAALSLV